MKNDCRRMLVGLCMLTAMCVMVGCTDEANTLPITDTGVQQETESESTEENIMSEENELQDEIADYGDCITISCEITEQPIVWEEAGEAVFQVATTSTQFQNEFEPSEEAAMKMVEKAIGKTAGESFTLWMEGGDGLYGYEYTIQEVVDKPTDTVAYGDKVYTSYSLKERGVDRGDEIKTGEQLIHVVDNDKFLAQKELEYSVSVAKNRIKSIVGKSVGDTFRIMQDSPEWSSSYLFTILQIDKAVAYGDTIKTTVRRANISAEEREIVSSYDDIELELLAPKGTINLAGNDLDMADAKRFLKEIQGKSIGDTVYLSAMTDSKRTNYSITILEVISGEAENGYFETEALMLAEEENSVSFCDDSKDASCYVIVRDAESNIVYEYAGGGGNDYSLIFSYSYEPEYDQQGRLAKETYSGDFEEICEYQYNEQGVCVEEKHSFPGTDFVYIDYYDDDGLLVRTEEPDKNGCKTVREYEKGDIICTKRTDYDSEGNASVTEYDEWGFWIEPEVFE